MQFFTNFVLATAMATLGLSAPVIEERQGSAYSGLIFLYPEKNYGGPAYVVNYMYEGCFEVDSAFSYVKSIYFNGSTLHCDFWHGNGCSVSGTNEISLYGSTLDNTFNPIGSLRCFEN